MLQFFFVYLTESFQHIDLDKAVIQVDLDKEGAIQALTNVLGMNILTAVREEHAVQPKGNEGSVEEAWQLNRSTGLGILHVRSGTHIQQEIANLVELRHNTIIGVRAAKKSMWRFFFSLFP